MSLSDEQLARILQDEEDRAVPLVTTTSTPTTKPSWGFSIFGGRKRGYIIPYSDIIYHL